MQESLLRRPIPIRLRHTVAKWTPLFLLIVLGAGMGIAVGTESFDVLGGILGGTAGLLAVYVLWKDWRSLLRRLGRLHLSKVLRFLAWGMIVSAPFGPVLALPQSRSLFLFRVLFILLASTTAVYLLLRPMRPSVRVAFPLGLILVWLAWFSLTLLWSADLQASLRYLTFFFMMSALVVAVVLVASDRRRLRISVGLLGAVYLVVIGIGLLEALTSFRLPTSTLHGAPPRFQWMVSSVFHNPNDFATYISLWFPLWLGVFFFSRNPLLLVASAAVMGLSLFDLVRTGSTLNAIALTLGAAVLLVVGSLRTLMDGSFPWRGFAIGVGAVGLVLFFATVFCPYWTQGILSSLKSSLGQSTLTSLVDVESRLVEIATGAGSGGNRMALIKSGWRVLQDYHLLGVGPGNAEYHMLFFPETGRVQNLHNWWMEVLVNGGIVAFGLYLVFYGSLLWGLLEVVLTSSDRPLAYLGVTLLASLVGFAVGCTGPSSVIHFTPMWIHFGLALAVINVHKRGRRAFPVVACGKEKAIGDG